jgi:hypothetical protein
VLSISVGLIHLQIRFQTPWKTVVLGLFWSLWIEQNLLTLKNYVSSLGFYIDLVLVKRFV